jgi:hypothetical protein
MIVIRMCNFNISNTQLHARIDFNSNPWVADAQINRRDNWESVWVTNFWTDENENRLVMTFLWFEYNNKSTDRLLDFQAGYQI